MTRRSLLLSTLAGSAVANQPERLPAGAELPGGEAGMLVRRLSSGVIMLSWNFTLGSHGWLPGFSDYTLGQSHLDLVAEIRPLPAELQKPAGHRGYYLQGNNRSDDLFMYLRRQLDSRQGLQPSRDYIAHMHIALASNAGSGCAGAGGAPGEGVYLKAGVFAQEPAAAFMGRDLVLTVDKGYQAFGGRDMHLLGNIANGRPCLSPGYVMLERVLYQQVPVRSTPEATLWAAVGTDSAHEGLTGYYIYTIGINLIPV